MTHSVATRVSVAAADQLLVQCPVVHVWILLLLCLVSSLACTSPLSPRRNLVTDAGSGIPGTGGRTISTEATAAGGLSSSGDNTASIDGGAGGQTSDAGIDCIQKPDDTGGREPRYSRGTSVANMPTVQDNDTGYLWQGCPAGLLGDDCQEGTLLEFTWQEAIDYCSILVWGGHADWRLPEIDTLETILDYGRSYPSLDTLAFPGPARIYNSFAEWSASSVADKPALAWMVSFDHGLVFTLDKSSHGYAVCVR